MRVFRVVKSFVHASHGIKRTLLTERNFWIHILAAAVVFSLAALCKVSAVEWILLILVVSLVLVLELVNTAIEFLLDLLKPRLNHHVLLVKDATAGAVLVAAVAALAVGAIIFIPHFQLLIK